MQGREDSLVGISQASIIFPRRYFFQIKSCSQVPNRLKKKASTYKGHNSIQTYMTEKYTKMSVIAIESTKKVLRALRV